VASPGPTWRFSPSTAISPEPRNTFNIFA
jgi:hypothetical protein